MFSQPPRLATTLISTVQRSKSCKSCTSNCDQVLARETDSQQARRVGHFSVSLPIASPPPGIAGLEPISRTLRSRRTLYLAYATIIWYTDAKRAAGERRFVSSDANFERISCALARETVDTKASESSGEHQEQSFAVVAKRVASGAAVPYPPQDASQSSLLHPQHATL